MRYDDCWQDESTDTTAGGAGLAAAITYAADTETRPDSSYRKYLIITCIEYSYSAAPTGGGLTITDGGTTMFQLDITAAGAGNVRFFPGRKFAAGSAVVVTLAAPGGAVIGKLNVHKRYGGSR